MSITSHPLWRFSRAPAAQSQPSEQSAEGVLCSGTVVLRPGAQWVLWALSAQRESNIPFWVTMGMKNTPEPKSPFIYLIKRGEVPDLRKIYLQTPKLNHTKMGLCARHCAH